MGKNRYYCKINGTIYNLQDVQNVIDGIDTENGIIDIMFHNHGFEPLDALLFQDVVEFNNNEIPADYNECLERMKAANRASRAKHPPTIKCPVCGSTNVGPISTLLRLLGAFSLGRTRVAWCRFECKHCGYMW